MVRKEKEMTGKQKAALLLISLGPEVAANVYKNLSEENPPHGKDTQIKLSGLLK